MRIAPPLLAILLTGAPGLAAQDPAPDVETPVDTSRAPLLAHKKLRQSMARLASEHSDLVTILPLGWSRGERYDGRMQIEALRLAAGELVEGRPAILIVANLEGPLAYTSGVALDLCRSLAEGYASDEKIRALLDSTTILVIPRANPDSAEARFRRVQVEVRSSGADADTDRDGLKGEDGRDDINGDGYVTVMRVPDPAGEWEADPADPRILRKADRKRGDRGIWKLVDEGRDSDGDGAASEDRPFDAEVNHNFGAGFEDHTPHAGLFPTSEPETRALCEFVMAHENIQLVLVYGELDNLAETPDGVADDAPSVKNIPPAGLRKSDAELLSEIGRRYREIAEAPAKETGDDAGSFQRWCYDHRGLMTLEMNLWSIPLDSESEDSESEDSESEGTESEATEAEGQEEEEGEPQTKPSDDVLRLRWAETHGIVDAHLGWTPYEHASLGAVEIGGFRPFALIEPPAEHRVRIADEQLEFLLTLGDLLAAVRLDEVWATDLGSGLLEVHATLINDSFFPLLTTWGRRTRTTRPARVLLRLPAGAEILAGERQTLVSNLPGLGGSREFIWLVRGAAAESIGVSVDTDHAGTHQAQPEVR